MPRQTPSQTIGPFFHIGLLYGEGNVLVDDQTAGERIHIVGSVIDGSDSPVADALVEIWQADAQGYFSHPADPHCALADKHFPGFGRAGTVKDGRFAFTTVKPGPTPGRDGQQQAPYVDVRVFARGMLIHAVTRLYFSDETANASDPLLNSIDPERRATLIAVREDAPGLPTYRFDIRLQGDHETVFFEV